MALTVHYSVKATVLDSGGNVVAEWKPRANSITTAGDNWIKSAANMTTSPVALPLGSVTLGAGGLWLFRNTSTVAAETITLSAAGGGSDTIRLAAGQEALAPLDAAGMAAFTAESASGAPLLDYMGIDP